jgi:hypothetical protein
MSEHQQAAEQLRRREEAADAREQLQQLAEAELAQQRADWQVS